MRTLPGVGEGEARRERGAGAAVVLEARTGDDVHDGGIPRKLSEGGPIGITLLAERQTVIVDRLVATEDAVDEAVLRDAGRRGIREVIVLRRADARESTEPGEQWRHGAELGGVADHGGVVVRRLLAVGEGLLLHRAPDVFARVGEARRDRRDAGADRQPRVEEVLLEFLVGSS